MSENKKCLKPFHAVMGLHAMSVLTDTTPDLLSLADVILCSPLAHPSTDAAPQRDKSEPWVKGEESKRNIKQ